MLERAGGGGHDVAGAQAKCVYQLDELPEQAFYMRGGIEEAIAAAEKMAAAV